MRTTEELYQLAHRAGLRVVFVTLRPGCTGLYLRDQRVIALDPQLRHDEKLLRAVLAHELGHVFGNDAGCKLPHCREARATRWAQQILIDRAKLAESWDRWVTDESDRFLVPVSWVVSAVQQFGMLPCWADQVSMQ